MREAQSPTQSRGTQHNFQEVIFIVSGNSHSFIIYTVYLKCILMLKLIVMLKLI